MVPRRRRPRRSGAHRRRGEDAGRLRRAVPAGGRRQLPGSAPCGRDRRGPVRAAGRAAAGLHGGARHRGRPSGARRKAATVRQSRPVATAGASGVSPPAPVAGGPRRQRHAADRRRGGRRRALWRRAGDHHAPRVLLAEAARRTGRRAARDLRRGPRSCACRHDHRHLGRPVPHPSATRGDDHHRRLQSRAG